jgi:hypothetical protein
MSWIGTIPKERSTPRVKRSADASIWPSRG